MIALDNLNPPNLATASLTVGVIRTPILIEFTKSLYADQLPETTPVGSSVIQVFAAEESNVCYKIVYKFSWSNSVSD